MPESYYVSQYSGEEIDDLLGKAGSATGAVRYDAAQSLTDAEQAQARGNIAAASSGGGVMETVLEVSASSASESYDTLCAKLDAVLATMPAASVKFLRVYPPQYYGSGSDMCALFKNTNDYASVYTIGSYNNDKQGFRMIKYKRDSSDPAGQWDPLEYINPPMQLGVEYRTTERCLGKPVYVKAIDFGAVAVGMNQVSFMSGVERPIRCYAFRTDGNATIPWIGTPGTDQSFCSINNAYARIHSTVAFPAGDVVFVGYYYKTNE